MIHYVSVSSVNTSIHPLSIMYPYPLSCLDYASIYNPQTLRTNIGPKVRNHPKSTQIQLSFRVDLGSPFVHLTKIHRFSGSFFGAHLFSLAIRTHVSMVCTELPKMLPIYIKICQDVPKLGFPKMKYGLFWVAVDPFGLEIGPNESKSV